MSSHLEEGKVGKLVGESTQMEGTACVKVLEGMGEAWKAPETEIGE